MLSTKICRGKIPEKIWLNIKHFIKRKIKIKIVSFFSRRSLVVECPPTWFSDINGNKKGG